jgi:hypothetical protein
MPGIYEVSARCIGQIIACYIAIANEDFELIAAYESRAQHVNWDGVVPCTRLPLHVKQMSNLNPYHREATALENPIITRAAVEVAIMMGSKGPFAMNTTRRYSTLQFDFVPSSGMLL